MQGYGESAPSHRLSEGEAKRAVNDADAGGFEPLSNHGVRLDIKRRKPREVNPAQRGGQ